jgi:hypothetical protein
MGRDIVPETRGTTCFYFAAEQPPLPGPDLALNGEGRGLINSLLVPSNLSDYYAPAGQHLITVNLLDARSDPDLVEPQLREELISWCGAEARRWKRLAVYQLPAALPDQSPPVPYPGARKFLVRDGLWTCSELGAAPSIQWALHSGTRAGESVSTALLGQRIMTTSSDDRAERRDATSLNHETRLSKRS